MSHFDLHDSFQMKNMYFVILVAKNLNKVKHINTVLLLRYSLFKVKVSIIHFFSMEGIMINAGKKKYINFINIFYQTCGGFSPYIIFTDSISLFHSCVLNNFMGRRAKI